MARKVHFCTFDDIIEYELPEEYALAEVDGDDFGSYAFDENGEMVLVHVNGADERMSYRIAEGTKTVLQSAFKTNPILEELFIPASVAKIEDGALSNSGSWVDDDKGFQKIEISSQNEKYLANEEGVYERLSDGGRKLIYCLSHKKDILIESDIKDIAEKAFYGKYVQSFEFEMNGCRYSLPGQPFHNEELLMQFGMNGKLYDFTEYDKFILRKHFSPDRLRMMCDRVTQDYDMADETKQKIIEHLHENIDKVCEQLIKKNGFDELRYLAESNILTLENVEELIAAFNNAGESDMLKYMIEYKHENFEADDFDFSI